MTPRAKRTTTRRTILVAHDLARGGRAALRAVAALVDARTRLVVLHVRPPSRPIEDGIVAVQDIRRAEKTRERLAARVGRTVRAAGVDCEVVIGDVVEALLHAARRADLLVMATGARVGLRRLARPSVLERVLRDAAVPVLVIGPRAARRASRSGRRLSGSA
jgi:nucleotide-binding universal stress UspA family protein